MDDLPLPQELKDEIYGHFFHGLPYRDAINLLLVNKTIGNNAEQYYYKYNTFVLVRFDCPDFLTHLHSLGVNIAADSRLENFTKYSYAIDVDWEFDVPSLLPNQTANQTPHSEIGSVILPERHLPELWSFMRLVCQHSIPNRVYVGSSHGQRLKIEAQGINRRLRTSRSRIKISAHDHEHRTLTLAEKNAFLQQFATVTGAGYRLRISGFDNTVAAQTKAATSPQLIWINAYDWDRIDLLYQLKGNADQLMRRGSYPAAGLQYDLFLRLFRMNPLQMEWTSGDANRIDANIRTQRLRFDLTISTIQCGLARVSEGGASDEQFRYVAFANAGLAIYRFQQLCTPKMLSQSTHFSCVLRVLASFRQSLSDHADFGGDGELLPGAVSDARDSL